MKTRCATLNEERIQWFKELASGLDQYEDVRTSFHNGMQRFIQSLVDDSIKTNAKFNLMQDIQKN